MLSSRKAQYLQALDIVAWHPRTSTHQHHHESVPDHSAPLTPEPNLRAEEPSDVSTMDWSALQECVKNCHRCDLAKHRTQTVFGVGDTTADVLIVGEAPGQEEDKKGQPFVGRAGQLLDQMLLAIGLKREQTYIANIVKCQPPGNRNPSAKEISACFPTLHRQIELVQPKLILALGRVSAHKLLASDEPISRLRNQTFTFENTGIPVIVSYHPAYLLRSPLEKRKVWEDLLKVKTTLTA